MWMIALASLLPLSLTALNLFTWPRGRVGHRPPGRVSALVPARNEAGNIVDCTRALLAAGVDEVIICDDDSKDETLLLARELAQQDARVRVICGAPLPPGWVGKPHACHQLAFAATGDWLLFVDADTRLLPGALERLWDQLQGADIVTAFPRQITGTFAEHQVIPLLHLTYLSWLWLWLIPRVSAPSVLAANGQLLFLSRQTYVDIGGFAAVKGEVVDDMAFCRLAKLRGRRVRFMDGFLVATCRMYRNKEEVFAGFSKNLYPGIGARPERLAAVLTLYFGCFLLPWLIWPWAPLAVVGIVANLLQRALIAWRFEQRLSTVLLHPLSIVTFIGIALNSWAWHHRGAIQWRGRSYPAEVIP